MSAGLLSLRGIVKRFGAQLALAGVDFAVSPGEVVALLGENGAGKSTLMNVAAGLLAPDSGEIRVAGERVRWSSARDARRAGISMVHQHFMLVPSLTVAENLALAQGVRGRFRRADLDRQARDLSARLGLSIGDPGRPVETLAVGEQQRVEILKALASPTRVLVLDEPTAVLTPSEVDELFAIVGRLATDGVGVVVVTHKLAEVDRIADRVVILRSGRTVAEGRTTDFAPGEIAARMVDAVFDGALPRRIQPTGADEPSLGEARAIPAAPAAAATSAGPQSAAGRPVRLDVSDLTVHEGRGVRALDGVSLSVRGGEMLAIAGVEGNGQDELLEALAGLAVGPPRASRAGRGGSAGVVRIDGRVVGCAADARAAGLAIIPADRHRDGLVLELEVWENLLLGSDLTRAAAPWGWLGRAAGIRRAGILGQELGIRPRDPCLPAAALSGGNQQRVILTRELIARQPTVIVAANPTRGLDLAATSRVHQLLRSLVAGGAAGLLLSTDLDEVLALGDRVGVLYRGHLVILAHASPSRAEIGTLMAGGGEMQISGVRP